MATTTFTTMIPTPQPKKPGPPVPPRPQQSSLLKTQQRDVSSQSTSSTAAATTATSQRLMSKVGLEQPQILKKPIIANASNTNTTTATANSTSVTTSGGRTVIYKSPSLNLQKRQDEREKRNEASTQTATTAITRTTSAAAATTAAANKAKLANGTQAPKPPLKLRKAPDVPTNFKPRITAPQPEVKETETKSNSNKNTNTNNSQDNNIVIVQSAQGVVTLNRHHSMGAASPQNKPSALAKDTRLSLGKVDFERVGKIQVQQLQPTSQPLPKPRKIVKVPVATLDVDDNSSSNTTTSSSTSSSTLHVNLFKRSKTSIENFTSRSNITTVNTNTTSSYLTGKTVEIKNNLKNAAERLFSEIMVNQQKQNALESNLATNTIITKHERAIQHQAEPMKLNNANNVTVVTTSKDYALNNDNNNCTRINITTTAAAAAANNQNTNKLPATGNVRQVVSAFNSPEKKSAAFHEMLISELAAMRTRSCSMENLQTTQQQKQQLLQPQSPLSVKESATIDKQFQNYKQFKTLEIQVNNNKQQQDQQLQKDQQQQQRSTPQQISKHHHHKLSANDDDIDADNIEDADGDVEEELKKSLKVITAQNSPRKRTPSGCSSDSSPYGTERSARIRTSDWIEVGDNGKQVTLTSCHISLEDSGLEDEERMDEMSSSGVGDSWDSVKEAEQHQQQQQQIQLQQQAKRNRNVKRIMSINDLPPLPKSLSGINKMLASDSGLVSDVDTEIKNTKNNELLKHYENQKENNNNLNINNNNNNNINSNNNNNALKDASDKFNNASSATTTTTTMTTATTSTTTPLKEINGNETISEIPPAIPGSKLDTQIATLRKEMFGLRQLDLSLLSQLWALNDSIQEFRTMIQEQEQDDDETYSTHSRSPSPYDSVSSDAEDDILTLKSKNRMELQNGNVITTQPKLTAKSYAADSEMTNETTTTSTTSSITSSTATSTISALADQQKSQLLKPPLPKPLDVKPVPRMRSAPPPPPTHRKSQTAPPRPT
ncbi:FAM89B-like [Lucilia cuprina]|nr:FAM89B-like [Lucilia cuprina]